jgi:hypothetical protein
MSVVLYTNKRSKMRLYLATVDYLRKAENKPIAKKLLAQITPFLN